MADIIGSGREKFKRAGGDVRADSATRQAASNGNGKQANERRRGGPEALNDRFPLTSARFFSSDGGWGDVCSTFRAKGQIGMTVTVITANSQQPIANSQQPSAISLTLSLRRPYNDSVHRLELAREIVGQHS